MSRNTYECLFLLDPNKSSSDWDGVVRQVNGLIERHGGTIVHTQAWGDTKLAYPIKKFRKGNYLLTIFESEASGVPAMEHECRLNETILRHLVIRYPDKIVANIVEHYRSPQKAQREDDPVAVGSREVADD